MKTGLKQRGRADFALFADIARWSGSELQRRSAEDLKRIRRTVDPQPITQRDIREATHQLEGSANYTWDRFYTRAIAEQQFRSAMWAYEDGRDEVEAEYAAHADAGGTIHADPTVRGPSYWSDTEFHLAPGGWLGHSRMGFMIHDYVYDLVFATGGIGAVEAGQSFFDARVKVAEAGDKDHYDTILDLGSGTGRYTVALQQTYPRARITGVDLGLPELEHAKLIAARNGYSWDLHQAACEDLPFDDDSFDLVTTFILFHETPVPAAREILAEAYRVTKPGGELLIGEVAPYKHQTSLFRCVVLDWETENRDEPYWRAALAADRAELVRSAGFGAVVEFGDSYPWITRAKKPEAAS